MIYDLPKTIEIGGVEYAIRSDFREILDIIEILNDEELKESERAFVTLLFFYPDFENMPVECYEQALEECYWFINGGSDNDESPNGPRLMDWQQDFPYIIAPVNRVIGHEIRADAYLHWWTFLSAYMEIGECTFAQIVHIRQAKAKGRKLDKADQEWYSKNRGIVDLKTKYTDTEKELLKKWGGAGNE